MEKLQELITFLKSKGLEDKKIDVDVLCAIIEYFGKQKESEQLLIPRVSQQRELLIAYEKYCMGMNYVECMDIINKDIEDFVVINCG